MGVLIGHYLARAHNGNYSRRATLAFACCDVLALVIYIIIIFIQPCVFSETSAAMWAVAFATVRLALIPLYASLLDADARDVDVTDSTENWRLAATAIAAGATPIGELFVMLVLQIPDKFCLWPTLIMCIAVLDGVILIIQRCVHVGELVSAVALYASDEIPLTHTS